MRHVKSVRMFILARLSGQGLCQLGNLGERGKQTKYAETRFRQNTDKQASTLALIDGISRNYRNDIQGNPPGLCIGKT